MSVTQDRLWSLVSGRVSGYVHDRSWSVTDTDFNNSTLSFHKSSNKNPGPQSEPQWGSYTSKSGIMISQIAIVHPGIWMPICEYSMFSDLTRKLMVPLSYRQLETLEPIPTDIRKPTPNWPHHDAEWVYVQCQQYIHNIGLGNPKRIKRLWRANSLSRLPVRVIHHNYNILAIPMIINLQHIQIQMRIREHIYSIICHRSYP